MSGTAEAERCYDLHCNRLGQISHAEGTIMAPEDTAMTPLAIQDYLRLLPAMQQTAQGYLWSS
jgi:hypothetical protein